jgi:hypothetical protein
VIGSKRVFELAYVMFMSLRLPKRYYNWILVSVVKWQGLEGH